MSQQKTCTHKTCKSIKNYRASINKHNIGGVGAIIMCNFYGSGTIAVLLGKERYGQYKGQFSICSGSVDPSDNGCYLSAIKRELQEEQKISLSWQDFDQIFMNSAHKYRIYYHHGSPIFVGRQQGLSRKIINNKISRDNADPTMPRCMQEISEVDYFRLVDQKQVECKPNVAPLSTFASGVLSGVHSNLSILFING